MAYSPQDLIKINLVRIYHPPINCTHLGYHMLVQLENTWENTKSLYEKGIEKGKEIAIKEFLNNEV